MKTKDQKEKAWCVPVDHSLDRHSGVNYAPEKSAFIKENKEAIKIAIRRRKAVAQK